MCFFPRAFHMNIILGKNSLPGLVVSLWAGDTSPLCPHRILKFALHIRHAMNQMEVLNELPLHGLYLPRSNSQDLSDAADQMHLREFRGLAPQKLHSLFGKAQAHPFTDTFSCFSCTYWLLQIYLLQGGVRIHVKPARNGRLSFTMLVSGLLESSSIQH